MAGESNLIFQTQVARVLEGDRKTPASFVNAPGVRDEKKLMSGVGLNSLKGL